MYLKSMCKIKSPTYVELLTEQGHPSPNVLTLITGSALETFVVSLPRVKNSSKIYDVDHICTTQTKKI
jgi:hypothetical protein